MRGFRNGAGLVAVLLNVSCMEGKACTDIGCSSGVSVLLAPDSGVWQFGDYQLEIRRDGATSSCGFVAPGDLPRDGALQSLDCGRQISADIWPRTSCTTTRHGDAVSQSCSPIENQYDLHLRIEGTPKNLSIQLTRDGEVIVNDSRAPKYGETSPNGPECGPTCRQASVELVVPPSPERLPL